MSADRDRRRGAPQGRSPLHHRQGPLHRRHQPARPSLRLFRPLPARSCDDQIDRQQGRFRMPGVVGVLTGAELAGDKIGNLICGWMIHSKDGSPMKVAPHPALATGKACHVGDPVAVVVAETLAQARDAAEKVKVEYAVLPAVADPAAAQKKGAPQIHEVAPNNTIYQWHLGDQKAVDAAFKSAKPCHQTRHHQQSPGAERHRAARRHRRIRCRHRRFHAVEYVAKSACRPSRHLGLHRHGARAQAARHRAGCRRRLRLEDIHLSRRSRGAVGVEATSAGR